MNLGNIFTASCVNLPPLPDERCNDPAFALNNPSVCPVAPRLIIKPGVSLLCALGSVQFRVYLLDGASEQDVTSECVFQTSDASIAVIGAASGNATGMLPGAATIYATRDGDTVHAEITVLAGENCCDEITNAIMVLVDQTKSMAQVFNGSYATKLAYAKTAAAQFINEANQDKDLVGLMQFTDAGDTILSSPVSDKAAVADLVPGITQTQESTSFYDALSAAIAALDGVAADKKIILLISDGEDQTSSYISDSNPIALLDQFKTAGGIVMCFGVRASGSGYGLLEAFSTGGFFINSYDGFEADALGYLSGIKGYVCAGNCHADGDAVSAQAKLGFCGFASWYVFDGSVGLIGNGVLDLLPGNGLYVDLAGGGKMVSKISFPVNAGWTYRLSVDVAGNQRSSGTDKVQVKVFKTSSGTAPAAPVANYTPTGSPLAQNYTVTYAFSYVSEHGETSIGGQTPVVIGSDAFMVGIECTPDPTATLIRLYRTIGDGSDGWYLIAELDANTGVGSDSLTKEEMLAQIASGVISSCSQQPIAFDFASIPDIRLSQTINASDFTQGFQTYSFSFTAEFSEDLWISIQQLAGSGPLLGRVKFENITHGNVYLDDDFDTENEVYVPPACGPGTYGDISYEGYNCYGSGCLSTPPPPQLQDPNPLSDIESGYVPPASYTSTKTVCKTCPDGFQNATAETFIPAMTGFSTPSGLAFSSGDFVSPGVLECFAWKAFPGHIRSLSVSDDVETYDGALKRWLAESSDPNRYIGYKFDTAKTVRRIGMQVAVGSAGPGTFVFEASNSTLGPWTSLLTVQNIGWFSGETKNFSFFNETPFTCYRVRGGGGFDVASLNMYDSDEASQQQCSTQTAESTISQADADAKATLAATNAALAALNCVGVYSSTKSFTAHCAAGTFGSDVTRSATRTSLNSQQEADDAAQAAAEEAANDALDCTGSNNTQAIQILDSVGGLRKSSPYPSVVFVKDTVGLVTKVTVTLHGFTHSNPPDARCLLVSPAGTKVELMRHASGTPTGASVSGLEITFDDAAVGSLNFLAMVSGTFKPTQLGSSSGYPDPAPALPYNGTLAAFIGEDPNGAWSLWFCDDTPLDDGSVSNGWTIQITAA